MGHAAVDQDYRAQSLITDKPDGRFWLHPLRVLRRHIPVLGIASAAGVRRDLAVVITVQASTRLPVDDSVADELPVLVIASVAAIRIDGSGVIAVQA